MLNEAPMTPGQKKAKAAQTKQQYSTAKGGASLANLRLKQKGGQKAQQKAVKKTGSSGANPQAVNTGPLAVKTNVGNPTPIPKGAYSAKNYKATMAKRRAAQKQAAALAKKNTQAVPTGQSSGGGATNQQTVTQQTPAKNVSVKKEKDKVPLKKRLAKLGAKGAAAAALAVPVVALHMGEGNKMKNFHHLREAKMVTGNETGMMFKVSIEGLPDMIMIGKSPGEIKGQLRKIVKQPSMIQSVERMPKSKVKMMYRDIVAGRDEDE